LTNGRQLYVLRRGSLLCVAQRDRLSPRGSDPDSRQAAERPVRYVVLASYRGERPPLGYRDVPEGAVIGVDRDLRVTQHPLSP
jgi:hypothetical protein